MVKAERLVPPYYTVIFVSCRRLGGDGDDGYDAMAERMAALSAKQPGFLGMDSARGADGLGITTCYWRELADIAAWKADLDHQGAQALGKAEWYSGFTLHIARVERVEGWTAPAAASAG